MAVCIATPVHAAWSIPDVSPSVQNWNGYWQFEYDPNNPISAAMYCCWWEMVHGHLSKYSDALSGNSTGESTSSGTSVETKSYCPACHVDDTFATLEVDPELEALHNELMQTKPWLKEGKNKNTFSESPSNNTSTKVMFFSEPTKI
jgi:hypothetical protein